MMFISFPEMSPDVNLEQSLEDRDTVASCQGRSLTPPPPLNCRGPRRPLTRLAFSKPVVRGHPHSDFCYQNDIGFNCIIVNIIEKEKEEKRKKKHATLQKKTRPPHAILPVQRQECRVLVPGTWIFNIFKIIYIRRYALVLLFHE